MNVLSIKAALWSFVCIAISGIVGIASFHDGTAEAPFSNEAEKNVNVSFRTDESGLKNELKPVTREAVLDPYLKKELMDKKKPLQGLFETSLVTVKTDGKIDIRFSLRNISGKKQQIVFASGQRYDITVVHIE